MHQEVLFKDLDFFVLGKSFELFPELDDLSNFALVNSEVFRHNFVVHGQFFVHCSRKYKELMRFGNLFDCNNVIEEVLFLVIFRDSLYYILYLYILKTW